MKTVINREKSIPFNEDNFKRGDIVLIGDEPCVLIQDWNEKSIQCFDLGQKIISTLYEDNQKIYRKVSMMELTC